MCEVYCYVAGVLYVVLEEVVYGLSFGAYFFEQGAYGFAFCFCVGEGLCEAACLVVEVYVF